MEHPVFASILETIYLYTRLLIIIFYQVTSVL